MDVTYQSEEEMEVCISVGFEHDHINDLSPHDPLVTLKHYEG